MTSAKAILDSAAHYHIEFIDNAHPTQHQIPNQITFSDTEQRIIDAEITKLLENELLYPANLNRASAFLRFLCVLKKDGNYRIILNLKQLNSFVE